MGDPAVIYFAFAAGMLSLVGFIVFVWLAKNRIGTAAFYVFGTALFWYWAWNTHLIPANTVGWMLVAVPMLLGGIRIAVAKLGR